MGYNVVIYDAGQTPQNQKGSRLIFGDGSAEPIETLENVVLDMTDCDLTAGLSGFTIGVNTAYCFALPEGAQSFLEYNGKCVGYYGEQYGHKEVSSALTFGNPISRYGRSFRFFLQTR